MVLRYSPGTERQLAVGLERISASSRPPEGAPCWLRVGRRVRPLCLRATADEHQGPAHPVSHE